MASPSNAYRAGRVLIYFTALCVFMAAWSLFGGQASLTHFEPSKASPRLGLDLRGGTQVILTPKQIPGEQITGDNVKQAVEIIRERVNAFGVAEAEVQVQGTGAGSTIIVSIPGKANSAVVDSLKSTAKLDFRPLLEEGQPLAFKPKDKKSTAVVHGIFPPIMSKANDAAFKAKFAQLDCTSKGALVGGIPDDPTMFLATCGKDTRARMILAPARVLGTQIANASAGVNQQDNATWQVNLTFDSSGAKDFATTTTELAKLSGVQNRLGIILDGLVVSSPSVNESILGGKAQITGKFSVQDAQNLANMLKYGALPVSLDVASQSQLSPTLGSDQLQGGLLAGLIGLIIVVIYLLVYYRALGVVAFVSLLVAAMLTYFSVVILGQQIGMALTLAGVAGLVVAIGITADSFVVYFERLRDEVREGKGLRGAASSGWVRARRTILAADGVSFLAAVVLYFLSVGSVRGFAFTLGLTTVIDVFVAFAFTRPVVEFIVRNKWFASGGKLTGLDAAHLGIAPRLAATSTQES